MDCERLSSSGMSATSFALSRRLAAEALGTGLLVGTVVGSGIMADRLAGGNVAIALLGNTIPTGAILVVLILGLAPISGAHFNPAVSLVMTLTGALKPREFGHYVLAQVIGGCLGTLVAHAMFDLPLFQLAAKARTGPAQWFAEFVATFGLIVDRRPWCAPRRGDPVAVGLYITAAYWFTASTSFANPAVTMRTRLTDTFAGIAPNHVLPFVVAQVALAGIGLTNWCSRPRCCRSRTPAIDLVPSRRVFGIGRGCSRSLASTGSPRASGSRQASLRDKVGGRTVLPGSSKRHRSCIWTPWCVTRHTLPKSVGVYALISRMRMASNANVVENAEAVIRTILTTYSRPNKTFPELQNILLNKGSSIRCSLSARYAVTSCVTFPPEGALADSGEAFEP